MIFQRLRVFVSSKMQELAPERQALKTALDTLKVDAWVFEQDAGARPESIQKAFLEEVEAADLYIGLFWKGYGEYTIEEYEHARKLGKDCLIYEKRAALNGQRDPRLQAFLDQLGNVETGLTIKWFEDAVQLNEAIKDDVARWQARKIRELHKPRINVNLSLAEKKERDELLILLRKVKEFWVEGVLVKSIHGQALIDLGKEAWTEKTEHPWEQLLELPDQTSRTLRPGEPIHKIFDVVGRSLLILGAPGSGKTITLLVLARELINRAENDPAQPIPVVFNLSSWNPEQTLFDWLIEELLVKYQIPRKIGRQWLERNWLVPLLDGLDEVKAASQMACVEKINAYLQNNGAPGLAVCSRLKEYTDLPVRLYVTGAICLQPLTPEQVKDYVARSGDALAGLNTALDKDPVLQELAETPLMLDVMSLAYRDLPAEQLTREELKTEKDRRDHLFNTYIAKMFARKGKGAQEFARKNTLGWLTWLARGMQQHAQTTFLIEQLQPSLLSTRGQRVVYILGSRMVFGLIGVPILWLMGVDPLIYALIGGMSFGLVPGLIDEWRFNRGSIWARLEKASPRWQTVILVLIFGLSAGAISGLSFWLFELYSDPWIRWRNLYGLLCGTGTGLFWGLRSGHRSLTSDIQSVETLRWSWVHARKGFASMVIVGVIFGIYLYHGFTDWLEFGLKFGLFGGMIGGFFGGLRGSILDIKAIPNLGIKLSMRNAVLSGGLGLVLGLTSTPIFGERLRLETLYPGVVFGLFAFFWYGGQEIIQHYSLRFILYWNGHMPPHYANFLDYAARLVFLQKVGGGYIFIHRLLLEHFAAMSKDEEEIAGVTLRSTEYPATHSTALK
jgi:eukaryotic-like serine/threonine-protein kinase